MMACLIYGEIGEYWLLLLNEVEIMSLYEYLPNSVLVECDPSASNGTRKTCWRVMCALYRSYSVFMLSKLKSL